MNFGNSTSGSINPLNLQKGNLLDLTKEAPSLKNCIVACGWKAGGNFDLDASAFMLDSNGRVTDSATRVVYFGKKQQEGIFSEADNTTGTETSSVDAERIHVALEKIPADVHEIVFTVNIFEAMKKRQTFGMVKDSYIRILDKDNGEAEVARYELRDNAANSTAVIFGALKRNGNGWTFETIGESLVVEDLNGLLMRYS